MHLCLCEILFHNNIGIMDVLVKIKNLVQYIIQWSTMYYVVLCYILFSWNVLKHLVGSR